MRTLNPMTRPNRAPLLAFVSALGGGAIVAVLLVAFGAVGSDTTKTVVQQAPLSKPVQQGSGRGLTARDIYKRDAPGVAFIRATIVQQSQSPFDFGPQTQQGTATRAARALRRSRRPRRRPYDGVVARVKICGLTNLTDAQLAADLGAWALGMVFWPRSPWRCPRDEAARITAALRRRVELAGVFVDAPLDSVARAADELALTMVQLHGDES